MPRTNVCAVSIYKDIGFSLLLQHSVITNTHARAKEKTNTKTHAVGLEVEDYNTQNSNVEKTDDNNSGRR